MSDAADDLARLIAEELALLDGDPDAFAKGDLYSHPVNIETRRDYMRKGEHLASVVSRRDADLQAKAWDEGSTARADEVWGKVPAVNPYRSRPPADTDTGRGQ